MGFWDTYEQVAKEESGGGGIVGHVHVDMGFKVYVGGYEQADTFFPVTDPSEAGREAVKAKAIAFKVSSGAPKGPQFGIQFRVEKAGAYSAGKPATWPKGDRFFNFDSWTDACREVVKPSLERHNIALPWDGWARIGFAPDPYEVKNGTKSDVDQDGNPREKQVEYITEVFPSREAAMEAIGATGDEPSPADVAFGPEIPDLPDGWDAASWNDVIPSLKEANAGGQTPKAIADEYGVPVKYVVQALRG